jgi:hypothetical protein
MSVDRDRWLREAAVKRDTGGAIRAGGVFRRSFSTRVLDAPRPRYETMLTGVDKRPFLVTRAGLLPRATAPWAQQPGRVPRPSAPAMRIGSGGGVAGRSYFRSNPSARATAPGLPHFHEAVPTLQAAASARSSHPRGCSGRGRIAPDSAASRYLRRLPSIKVLPVPC